MQVAVQRQRQGSGHSQRGRQLPGTQIHRQCAVRQPRGRSVVRPEAAAVATEDGVHASLEIAKAGGRRRSEIYDLLAERPHLGERQRQRRRRRCDRGDVDGGFGNVQLLPDRDADVRIGPGVLTDFSMPAHDGVWLLEQVNQHSRPIPVISVSGFAESQVPRLAQAPFARRLLKPVDPWKLAEVIVEVLRGRPC
jgi:CheY-like chemotaxis protein